MHRSCISRAYYAAYAGATAALVAADVQVGDAARPNPSHARLASLVKHNLDSKRFSNADRSDLARRVRNLRRTRELAEYDPRCTVDGSMALQSVRDASVVIARFGGG
jgi:hypothetical protein